MFLLNLPFFNLHLEQRNGHFLFKETKKKSNTEVQLAQFWVIPASVWWHRSAMNILENFLSRFLDVDFFRQNFLFLFFYEGPLYSIVLFVVIYANHKVSNWYTRALYTHCHENRAPWTGDWFPPVDLSINPSPEQWLSSKSLATVTRHGLSCQSFSSYLRRCACQ